MATQTPPNTVNVEDPEPNDNLTPTASSMSVHVSSEPSEADGSGRASVSEVSSVPTSIGGKIRKNLNKKKQTRPKNEQLRSDQRPTTAAITGAPPPLAKDEGGPSIAPRRKSLLDYVDSDLAKSGQKSVLFRFLAVGSHEEDPEDFLVLHEKISEIINAACYDEPLTGNLIVYPRHFSHMLEGSELNINKYIAICAELFEGLNQTFIETDYHVKTESDKTYNVRMVILHCVMARERYTTEWYHVVHYSPPHRGRLMRFHGFRKRLYEFIKNFLVMAGVLAESYAKNVVIFSEDPLEAALEAMEEKELYRSIQEKLYTLFPGTDMLNYLLKIKKRTPPLRTPKEHIEKYWTVPNIILDSEVTWPVPCRLQPYH